MYFYFILLYFTFCHFILLYFVINLLRISSVIRIRNLTGDENTYHVDVMKISIEKECG